MNIICDKQALIDAVGNVQRAVSGKSTLPALEGILLRAAGSSLFLAGFDLDLGITTTIDADVRQPGEIVLTAKLFGEIVRKLPGRHMAEQFLVIPPHLLEKQRIVAPQPHVPIGQQPGGQPSHVPLRADVGPLRLFFRLA